MLVPLAATIAGASALIYTKYLFRQKHVGYLAFTVQSFLAILFVLLPGAFFFPFPAGITLQNLLLFLLLVTIGCFWNIMFYHGFKDESLVESQLVTMLVPLISSLFGFLFFIDERDISTIFFLGIGVIVLIWSHVSHHKLRFHKGSWYIIVASLFIAAESVLIKILLPSFSAFWLYFARIIGICLVLVMLFPGEALPHSKAAALRMLAVGVLVSTQFILIYKSYAMHGLVYSNLVFALLPVVTAFAGHFLFHEHVSRKQLIAGFILLSCIILAQFF